MTITHTWPKDKHGSRANNPDFTGRARRRASIISFEDLDMRPCRARVLASAIASDLAASADDTIGAIDTTLLLGLGREDEGWDSGDDDEDYGDEDYPRDASTPPWFNPESPKPVALVAPSPAVSYTEAQRLGLDTSEFRLHVVKIDDQEEDDDDDGEDYGWLMGAADLGIPEIRHCRGYGPGLELDDWARDEDFALHGMHVTSRP